MTSFGIATAPTQAGYDDVLRAASPSGSPTS